MCFLSLRTIICQSSSSLLMMHNLLVSYSGRRFTTPSIITGVSVNSQIVLGNMLCFGLLSLTRRLLSLWTVSCSISIHFSLSYWNTLFYQTQRHSDLPLPTWLVPVDQCLFLIGLLSRYLWNLLCHSKCPWMLTLWWPSHPVGAIRMVTRSILCRSISYPFQPLMFVAQCHKERLRLKPCYTTSRRTLTDLWQKISTNRGF